MAQCSKCGQHLARRHRTPLQKLFYTDLFYCPTCGHDPGVRRFFRRAPLVLSRYTRCVRCRTTEVHRLAKRDRIDYVAKSPLSWMLFLTGAPLYKCPACRLQYYDWRPIRPSGPS